MHLVNPNPELYAEEKLCCIRMHVRQQLVLFSEVRDKRRVLIARLAAGCGEMAEPFSRTAPAEEVVSGACLLGQGASSLQSAARLQQLALLTLEQAEFDRNVQSAQDVK
jgi:hypothetical protein